MPVSETRGALFQSGNLRIKICGITNPEDAGMAARAGADAIGINLFPGSKRFVEIADVCDWLREMPVTRVAVVVNASADLLARVQEAGVFDAVQFHGDETPEQCDALGRAARLPWLRAVRVGPSTQPSDLVESALHYSKARGLLFDTLVPDYGGSGKVFDWSLIPAELAHRAVLSGGLSAQNVGDAIRQLRPFAVDVSSGIEVEGAKGVKDHARMAAFVRAVREADAR